MAQLWDLGVRGTTLDVVAAWKEALLLVALLVVAWHVRRFPAVKAADVLAATLRDRHRRLLADPAGRARRRGDDARRAARAPSPPLPGRGLRARPARGVRLGGARARRRSRRAVGGRRRGRRARSTSRSSRCRRGATRASPAGIASSSGSTTRGSPACPRTGSTTRATRTTRSGGSSRRSSRRSRARTRSSSR